MAERGSSDDRLPEIFRQLKSGERAQLTACVNIMRPLLYQYALSRTGDMSSSEDLVQETLVKIFAQVHNYDERHHPLAWAYSILFWECKTFFKKRSRLKEVREPEEYIDVAQLKYEPEQEIPLMMRDIEASFQKLSSSEKETIMESMSSLTKQPMNSAERQRSSRAFRKFKKLLKLSNFGGLSCTII